MVGLSTFVGGDNGPYILEVIPIYLQIKDRIPGTSFKITCWGKWVEVYIKQEWSCVDNYWSWVFGLRPSLYYSLLLCMCVYDQNAFFFFLKRWFSVEMFPLMMNAFYKCKRCYLQGLLSFIQRKFLVHLLCSMCCARLWEYINEWTWKKNC